MQDQLEASTSGRDVEGHPPSKSRKRPKPDAYLHDVHDRKLKGKLRHTERLFKDSRKAAAKVQDWLQPADAGFLQAEGIEQTWQFQQEAIVQAVDVGAARKVMDLRLPELGPYSLDFTRSGRYMALAGQKGHLAVMDWQRSRLECEVQVRETMHDVQFLHNELFFAAAQKKYVYIYDKRGIEIHCLRDHAGARRLQFLPHHFLLASIGETGVLHYQDTSTGRAVAQHRTKLGPCDVMRQNPHNAMLLLGHARGTISMWTPNISTPVVQMLCHNGPVTALAVDATGNHLVTAGMDKQVKVWDVRTYKPLHAYFANSPPTALDISQRGLLAVAQGRRLQVWQDALAGKAQAPYMTHSVDSIIQDFHFCPFEDVLGIGHAKGISTMLVPGAGEPNFDSFVADPFQSRKQRREQEVVQLLDKLQPETIVLDPESIGKIRKEPLYVQKERHEAAADANRERLRRQHLGNEAKTKMKGKNKPSRRQHKKQVSIIEEKKPEVAKRMREQEARRKEKEAAEKQAKLEAAPAALRRFYQ